MPETLKVEKTSEEPKPEEQHPVRRICSWCEKDLGLADFTSPEPGIVTNTICDECKEKFLKDLKKEEAKGEDEEKAAA